jgi:aryl-alcohol dehydrogenase-like predicted oxidoreductase
MGHGQRVFEWRDRAHRWEGAQEGEHRRFFSTPAAITLTAQRLQYNIPRHRVVILTRHIFMVPDTMEESVFDPTLKTRREYVNEWGLSRAALFHQVDASLARLGTDYIDLFSIGRVDLDNVSAEVRILLFVDACRLAHARLQETMKALHDLVQSGKIRYIGASSMWTWQFAHYNHVADVRPSVFMQAYLR